MFFPLSTIKKFHVEIVFVAWLRDLSWEVKIVFLFLRRHFQKVLYPSLILFVWFLNANIICICHYFRWLSWPLCVHARASSYTVLFRVSLRGVGHKCVGLAQKISARCNSDFYVFSFFFICIFILLLALSHMYVFFNPSARSLRFGSRLWLEKSILTRTETFSITICFKEPLLFISLFLKRICFYLPFTSINTWN